MKPHSQTPSVWNVLNYGAARDGQTLDTAALQATIDACAQAGGGTVHVPAGAYLTGSLFLKSDPLAFFSQHGTSTASITFDLKCEIVEVQPEDGTILLRDLESGAEATITIADGIKLRARRKKDFGGRRKLALKDLVAGQNPGADLDHQSGGRRGNLLA